MNRKTRRGREFYGCSLFPKCKFASWDEPFLRSCPKCGKPILLRKQRKNKPVLVRCWDEACGYEAEEAPPEGGTAAEPAPSPSSEPSRE